MSPDDLILGLLAAISAGILTALAILAVPTARCLLNRFWRQS